MIKHLLLPVLFCTSLLAPAQRYTSLLTLENGPVEQSARNYPLAKNPAGEIYTALPFNEVMSLGGTTLTPLSSTTDLALVKLDASGDFLWMKAFGTDHSDDVFDLVVDENGQVYVSWVAGTGFASYYFDESGIDPGGPSGFWNGITCFSGEGTTLWHRSSAPGGSAVMACHPGESGVFTGDQNAIRRLDASGGTMWELLPQPLGAFRIRSIGVADGLLTVGGDSFNNQNTVTVDTVTSTVEWINGAAVFLLDTAGHALWGRSVGNFNGSYAEDIRNIAIDPVSHDVYCALAATAGPITFAGELLFNPLGPGNPYIAVLKYDAAGNEQWGRHMHAFSIALHHLSLLGNGDVVIGGKTSSSTSAMLNGVGYDQGSGNGVKAYVAALHADGTTAWVKNEPRQGNTSTGGTNTTVYGTLSMADGTIMTSCYYWPTTGNGSIIAGCLSEPTVTDGLLFCRIDPDDVEPLPNVLFEHSMSGDLLFARAPAQQGAADLSWSYGDATTGAGERVAHVYAAPGTFQVCLNASNNCGTAVHCETVDFAGLRDMEPRKGGQGGLISVLVLGGGFNAATTFKLTRTGEADLLPTLTTFGNSGTLFGRLDLTGVALGPWNVEVDVPGLGVFTLADAFTVEPLRRAEVQVKINGSRAFRAFVYGQQVIRVSNTGNEDALLVPLYIEMPAANDVIWFAEAIDRHDVPGNEATNAILDASGDDYDQLTLTDMGYGLKRVEMLIPIIGGNSFVDYRLWIRGPISTFAATATVFPPMIGSTALSDPAVMPEPSPFLFYLQDAAEWYYHEEFDNAQMGAAFRESIRNYADHLAGQPGGTGGWGFGATNPGFANVGGIGNVNIGPNVGSGYGTTPVVVGPPWTVVEGNNPPTNPPTPPPPAGPPPPPPPTNPPPPTCTYFGCCNGGCGTEPEPEDWPWDEPVVEWDPDGDGEFEPFDPPRPETKPDETGDEDEDLTQPEYPTDPDDPEEEFGCLNCDEATEDDTDPEGQSGMEDCDTCDEYTEDDVQFGEEVDEDGGEDTDQALIGFFSSYDPNAIYGPVRNGDIYLNNVKNHAYTITFENLATAALPARTVVVIDTLDVTKFDPNSFRFSTITIGDDAVISLEPDVWSANHLVDLSGVSGLYVGVHAQFDPLTGVIRCEFTSIDPQTMAEPLDPLVGFLPPNTVANEGTGAISYIVNFRTAVQHGEAISNRAAIYFDTNDPIVTNTHTNIIDFQDPVGEVLDLPSPNTTDTLHLQLSSTDDLSGVAFHHVFVSVNNHLYRRIATTTRTDIPFIVSPGHTYRFFSLAVDKAGNVESVPNDPYLQPDAFTDFSTSVAERNADFSVTAFPNPARNLVTCEVRLPAASRVRFELLDQLGKHVTLPTLPSLLRMSAGEHRIAVPIGDLQVGVYTLRVSTERGARSVKVAVVR